MNDVFADFTADTVTFGFDNAFFDGSPSGFGTFSPGGFDISFGDLDWLPGGGDISGVELLDHSPIGSATSFDNVWANDPSEWIITIGDGSITFDDIRGYSIGPGGGVFATFRILGDHESQPVPEPMTFTLVGMGLAGMALKKRLKRT